MAELKIDRCKREDFSSVVKMWEAWCEETRKKSPHFPVKAGSSWNFQEHLSNIFLDGKYALFVAKQDGLVMGFCMGFVEANTALMEHDKIGKIENFCVNTESQEVKQGLFDALAVWFKAKGVAVMEISIFDPSGDTLKVWSGLGFRFTRAVCQKPLS